MNTNEIARALRDVPNFIGVFPRDRLPRVTRGTFSFVFNTDPGNKPGKHWVAVYVTSERTDYFDSTGKAPIIQDFLVGLGRPIYYSNYLIQAKESIACGLFACNFIRRRSQGESFCEILDSFSRNTLFNDFLLSA